MAAPVITLVLSNVDVQHDEYRQLRSCLQEASDSQSLSITQYGSACACTSLKAPVLHRHTSELLLNSRHSPSACITVLLDPSSMLFQLH